MCSIAQELNVCPHSLNKTHSVETNMALHPFVCVCFCEVNTCMAFFSFGNTLWASKICSRKWHFIWIQVMLCWACLCSFACMTVCVHISQKEGLGGGGGIERGVKDDRRSMLPWATTDRCNALSSEACFSMTSFKEKNVLKAFFCWFH